MEFIESIQEEGVVLKRQTMGEDSHAKAPLVIEVDKANPNKDIHALDIEIPILTRRVYREYKGLAGLTIIPHDFKPVTYQEFTEAEQREIVFRDLTTDEGDAHYSARQCTALARLSQCTQLFRTDHHERA